MEVKLRGFCTCLYAYSPARAAAYTATRAWGSLAPSAWQQMGGAAGGGRARRAGRAAPGSA